MQLDNSRMERVLQQCLSAIDYYRGMDLDLSEQEFGEFDNWSFIRGRILKLWGDRGLSGRISAIIKREFEEG